MFYIRQINIINKLSGFLKNVIKDYGKDRGKYGDGDSKG